MRATSRIESLSYETIYMTGFIVALFLSFGPHSPLQRFLLHTGLFLRLRPGAAPLSNAGTTPGGLPLGAVLGSAG